MPAHRAAALLGAGDDAEDVIQDAFVKAFRKLRWFREGAPFRPWLLTIVVNETKNLHRSRQRRDDLALRLAGDHPVASPDGAPEEQALADERRTTLRDAVRALPDKDRMVVLCRYFLDLSEAETAEALGWPRGSVKSRTSRALGRLRSQLAPVEVADG